ncbi:MAG: aldehyde ferredoxin oxidoreductase family protein [Chloroflexota bacterium]
MLQPILKVDLTRGETSEYIVPDEWQRDYLGGASLAARLLYSSLTKELDPFSPEAPLLFLNGPLSGTLGPTVGRFVVCGKSPLTGLWAESNCGGFWGPELRFAGYDGVWITGKADRPVYLWLNGGQAEVRDAAHLWGQDTYQVQESIKKELGVAGARVAGIGPAGENRVLFSGIFCDHGRTAGRTGLGAVMGAKNLKAIAVKGNGKIPLADAAVYNALRSSANKVLKGENESRVLHDLGTSSVTDYADYLGSMPKMYYHLGQIDNVDKVSGPTMAETILKGTSACHGCVIACGRVVDLGDGRKRKGPEYETIVGLGPNILIRDLGAVTRLMELCDRYGMDTISVGGTLGLALHLFDRGVIDEKDTGGLTLRWGDEAVAAQLIHWMARREGFGEWLAQGSRRLGAHFNAEGEAVQVNGMEVAYHDPRGVSGMALVYATSPRGACHNQSDYFFVEWGQAEEAVGLKFFDRQAGAEKAGNVAIHQDWRTVFNALVMCIFANVPPQTQVDLINAACGYNFDIEEMMKTGERGWNLKRLINNNMGLTRANDKLPKALLTAYTEGGSADYVPPFDEMLEAYYDARGWDKVTGKPSKDKLKELGLEEIARDLWG